MTLAALIAAPALAETCPPGVGKLHGVCQGAAPKPSDLSSEAPKVDPFAGLTPRTMPGTTGSYGFHLSPGSRIGPAWIDGAYAAAAVNGATSDLVISRLKGTNLTRFGIALCAASNVEISDFDLQHSATPNTGTDLPGGIVVGRTCGQAGHDISIHDGRVGGFRMSTLLGAIHNGDGMAIEGGFDRVTIARVTANDNSDAGFDLKATNLRLDDLTAERNDKGFKIWSPSATAGALTVRGFGGGAIYLPQASANLHVARFVATGGGAGSILFRLNGGRLEVDSCDLTGVLPGTVLTKVDASGSSLRLGAGCKLP